MFIIDVKLSTQRERERERGFRNTCTYCTVGWDCDVVAFSWYFMLSYTPVLSSFSHF